MEEPPEVEDDDDYIVDEVEQVESESQVDDESESAESSEQESDSSSHQAPQNLRYKLHQIISTNRVP